MEEEIMTEAEMINNETNIYINLIRIKFLNSKELPL